MSKNSHAKHEHKKHSKQYLKYEKPHEDYKAGVWGDVLVILLIIGLGLFFIMPFFALMPSTGQVMIMTIFLLIVAIFAGLVWRNKPADEREAHQNARVGNFVFSLAIISIGALILYQVIYHKLDIALMVILLLLVVARVGYAAYLKSKV